MAIKLPPFEQAFPIDRIVAQKRSEGMSDADITNGLAHMKAEYERLGGSIHDATTFRRGMEIAGAGAAGGAGLAAAGGVGAAGAAGAGAAGGTAGAGTILNTASTLAPILGGISAGRQAGREAEAGATQRQDQNAITAANTNLGAGQHRADQSVRGDYLANATKFHFNREFGTGGTGGFSPDNFSENTRSLGRQLSSDALRDQTTNQGRAVGLTPLPQAGPMDSILNTATDISSLMSVLPYKRPKPVAPPVPQPWGSDRLNGMGY